MDLKCEIKPTPTQKTYFVELGRAGADFGPWRFWGCRLITTNKRNIKSPEETANMIPVTWPLGARFREAANAKQHGTRAVVAKATRRPVPLVGLIGNAPFSAATRTRSYNVDTIFTM